MSYCILRAPLYQEERKQGLRGIGGKSLEYVTKRGAVGSGIYDMNTDAQIT